MFELPRLGSLRPGHLVEPVPLLVQLVWELLFVLAGFLANEQLECLDYLLPRCVIAGECVDQPFNPSLRGCIQDDACLLGGRALPRIGCKKVVVIGDPDPDHISTSFVERQNLTMRMSMRRFTRLTNAFSRKQLNHAAAVALYFMYYNVGRVHQTLRVTPAMEAGIADHVWTVEEIVSFLSTEMKTPSPGD